jgi:hypothetical protein
MAEPGHQVLARQMFHGLIVPGLPCSGQMDISVYGTLTSHDLSAATPRGQRDTRCCGHQGDAMSDSDSGYEFGRAEDELARLEVQGRALAPATCMNDP